MVTKSRQKPKPEDAGDDYKPEYEDYTELETINSMTPIWKKRSRRRAEGLRRVLQVHFHDFEDPARTITFHAEGALEYDALLFIPGKRSVRPVQQGLREGPGALQLQRADHGEVRRPAARLLQLRARRCRFARCDAQHFAARRCSRTASCALLPTAREEDHERARGCATTTARPTRSSSRTLAAA